MFGSLYRYPAINKPAGVVHWLKYSEDAKNVDWVVVLDADMIIRGPIVPWELGAEKGYAVAAYYGYLLILSFLLNHITPKMSNQVSTLKTNMIMNVLEIFYVANASSILSFSLVNHLHELYKTLSNTLVERFLFCQLNYVF